MTSISTLGQSLTQIKLLTSKQFDLNTLQIQLSSGKKTQAFKGLGVDVLTSKRARANFNALDNFINNIDVADRRLKLMVSSVNAIKEQAKNLSQALNIQTQEGEFEIDSISKLAKNTFDFLVSLVNIKDGDRFLFAGADALTEPLKDTGTLDTYLQTQLTDWTNTTINTDQFITNFRDRTQLTDTISGFSASLSSGNTKDVSVRVEENTSLEYTVLGNNDGFRDLMVAVGMIKNIPVIMDKVALGANDDPSMTTTAPGATKKEQNAAFFQMFNDLSIMLVQSIDNLDSEIFELSLTQGQLLKIKDDHKLEQNILLSTISDVEDIDITEVALGLNNLQTQLEASFRVTSLLSSLSLVNFI